MANDKSISTIMKKRLAAIRKYSNIQRVLNRIIKDNETEIIAMNRDQMWEDGITDVNNPGSILEYAPSTAAQKRKRERAAADLAHEEHMDKIQICGCHDYEYMLYL